MAAFDSAQSKVRNIVKEQVQHFRSIQKTGSAPTRPGIYECQNCGFEDLINRDCDKLPPCSDCEGSEWLLIVYALNSKQKKGKIF